MSEYAKLGADEIKIGTCESMYYLRAADRFRVSKVSGSLDPAREYQALRFRFPFPDEDGMAPGSYESHEPATVRFNLPAWDFLAEVQHYSIQLSNPKGLLASVPCPVSGKTIEGLKVHKNGYAGDCQLDSTAFRDGSWVVVLRCVCGALFWIPSEHGEELADTLRERGVPALADRVAEVYLECERVTA